MPILSEDYKKLIVLNIKTGEELVVIDSEHVDIAGNELVVKLIPKYD